MLTTTSWRDAIEHINTPVHSRGLALNEQRILEEHALTQRLNAAAVEYRQHTGEDHASVKQDTWFYPVIRGQTMGFYDVVLGWNHAVVLVPVGLGLYAVQWILAYTSDRYHKVHGGVGVDVHEAGTTAGWTVYAPRQKPMLRRVTTYNATTCSVGIVFPADGSGRLLMSHIDASPPIPWGRALNWCDREEERSIRLHVGGLNGRRLRAMVSICPDRAEVAKFRDDACLAGGTLDLSTPLPPPRGSDLAEIWSLEPKPRFRIVVTPPPPPRVISTVALYRGAIPDRGVGPSEFNTQAGLVFARHRAPVFRVFLGNPPMLYIGLVPIEVQRNLTQLAGRLQSYQQLQAAVTTKLRELKTLADTTFVYKRAEKQLKLEQERDDAIKVRNLMRQGLDGAATLVLQPLLDGDHGMRRLHQAVYDAFDGSPYQRALLINEALTSPISAASRTVQREIERYFRVVDIPVTPLAHQALVNNA